MKQLRDIEALRLTEQERIDALKSSPERNRLGQFATPAALAADIARFVQGLWGNRGPVRFLEPAIGTGAFYSAALAVFSRKRIAAAMGFEVDRQFVDAAKELWQGGSLNVVHADFTTQPPPSPADRYNLVLTNPPYVRHHHLNRDQKEALLSAALARTHLNVSGLAGLYSYFVLLAHSWMTEDALAAWLIPSEFMEVNYGSALRRYLTEKVTTLHLHRFSPEDVQFCDALVTSVVVVFRNEPPAADHRVTFSYGASLNSPTMTEDVSIAQLKHTHKWTQYPTAASRGTANHSDGIRLSDLFTIKRGLATGANGFFIAARQHFRDEGIPEKFLRPILPSPRLLREVIIERGSDGYPVLEEPLALIDCDLPEEEVRKRHPRFWNYLERGKAQGLHSLYLTSRRSPWYSQERRPAAPFLCTYMGRQRVSGRGTPFRFFWNKSDATAANVFLLLYPKPELAVVLEKDPELAGRVFEIFQRLDARQLLGEARVYGGGLHKVEPKELGRIPGESLLEALPIRFRPTATQLSLMDQ